MTEGVLYSLLPSLLEAAQEHYSGEANVPTHAYNEVASGALSASCLLNAPPGFIEFLLCSPWSQMELLQRNADLQSLLGAINISAEQRAAAVNTRMPDYIVAVVLEFIYREPHEVSLPPLMLLTHDSAGTAHPPPQPLPSLLSDDACPHTPAVVTWPPVTMEVRVGPCIAWACMCRGWDPVQMSKPALCGTPCCTHLPSPALHRSSATRQVRGPRCVQVAEALLQQATPLHCTAVRGNPAQTDHLVYCQADPTVRNAAGMLPLEVVPLCGDRDDARERACRCMHAFDSDMWECRSRLNREILMQSMLLSVRAGARSWVAHACKVAQCWLGVWGLSKTLWRPQIESHVAATRRRRSNMQREESLAGVASIRQLVTHARENLRSADRRLDELLVLNDAVQPVATGVGEGSVRTLLEVQEADEAHVGYGAAVAEANAAAAGYQSAATLMLKLAKRGFMMRPQQLHLAQQHCDCAIAGACPG